MYDFNKTEILTILEIRSRVGGVESYCTDILICSATLHSLWGPQPERVLQLKYEAVEVSDQV